MKLATAVAILLACGKPTRDRLYSSITALEDGTAIVAWREANRGYWIGHLDRSHRLRWSTELHGWIQDAFPNGSVLVADGVVGVRTLAPAPQLEGVELATGNRLWRTPLGASRGPGLDRGMWPDVAGLEADDSILAYVRGDEEDAVFAIEPRTGRVVRQLTLPAFRGPQSPLQHRAGVTFHDGIDGAMTMGTAATKVESVGTGCVIAGEYWRLTKHAAQWRLATIDDRFIPLDVPADRVRRLHGCAAYAERFVIFLELSHPDGSETVVRALDEAGDTAGQIRVLGVPVGHELRRRPEASHASGAMSRYTPIIFKSRVSSHLVMLDLEQLRIAWETPLRGDFRDTVFRASGHWYVGRYRADSAYLGRFDGAGHLARAVQIGGPIHPIGPSSFGGTSLWIASANWGSGPAFARLDPDSLERQDGPAGRIELADALANPVLGQIPRR